MFLHKVVVPALAALAVACGSSLPSEDGESRSSEAIVLPVALTATPTSIRSGTTVRLMPHFIAGTGEIMPGIGRVMSDVAVPVRPTVTTTYTLRVRYRNQWTTRSVTVTVAPPGTNPGQVVVYDDSLAPNWQDWSWGAPHNLANTSTVSSGTRSISVNFTPWSGLSFFLPGGVSGAGAGTLEFDVNGGTTNGPAINAMAQVGGAFGPQVRIAPYCDGGAIPAGAFTHCKVPLAALQAANVTLDRFALKEASGLTLATIYVDQIVIVPGAAPKPQIQSFTASPPAIDPGRSAVLSAVYTGGTGTINQGVGPIASGGTVTVSPVATTAYTLTVTDGSGNSATSSLTVIVNPAPAPNAVLVYDDALAAGWQDWSWVDHDLANAFPVSSGTRSISVDFTPWSGLSFFLPGGVSGAGAGTLEFDVNGGTGNDPAINAMVQVGVNGAFGPEVRINPYCDGGVIPAAAFTHCKVPLAALQAANTTFQRFALKEASGVSLSTVYVDQISIVPAGVTQPPPQIQSFTATPPAISAGGSSVLSAVYSGGTATIDQGVGSIASGGTVTVSPAVTTTYTLSVSDGAGHVATATVTVTVNPLPAIQSFTATPSTIAFGGTAVLTAAYSGGLGTIDQGVGQIASGGIATVSPSVTTTYALSVSDAAGHVATASVTVTVNPPPAIQSFTATPAAIIAGGSAVLAAAYTDGTGSIDQGVGPIASGAAVTVSPSATTTYTLSVSDGAGNVATASVTVTVRLPLPAIQSFTASPSTISAGDRATLSAMYSGGIGAVDQGVGAIASGGSVTVSPAATTTYTLSVSDGLGNVATASVTVTVNPLPAIQSFTATPATINPGGSATLSATYSDGTGTVDQGVGPIDSGGSVTVSPSLTTVYTLTVSDGAGHSARATAVVTVAGTTPPDISDIIPADRLTDWVPGMMAVGGIPARTTVCATVNASSLGDGTQEASGAIQAAINACPAGQVVQLSAGTFLTNNYVLINKSITLRGAGASATTLQKTNGAKLDLEFPPDAQPIVIVGPNRFPKTDDSTSQDLTADGAKGSHSVTVANAGGFAPGQIVLLDELSGASWQLDRLGRGQIWASPDYRVVWQFHNPSFGGDDPLTATTPTGGDAASWFSRRDRVTAEWKEIASISGNVVTFSTPLHIDYRTSHTAQLTRSTGNDVHVKNAGVESLKVIGGSDGAIRFENAAYSWAKAVEITIWHNEGVAVERSFRVEVRDSYIHDAAWAQPGGAGYAISLATGTAEALFENNISIMANKVMVARCAGAGSVFGYNYVDDGYINTIEGWIEIGLNASHMVGPHHVLFEGNYGFNWDSDHTHGNSIYHTVFRNHLRGVRKPFTNPHTGDLVDDSVRTSDGPRRCVGATAYSYWMSFVGNVLGAQGQMGDFVFDGIGKGAMDTPSIWLLGWDDASPQPYDPVTATTALRHGNFDYLINQVAWDPTIVDHTLPASLYLPDRPAFFDAGSGYTWPWVEPTGTTKLYTLPAKARFDAGTPFVQP